VHSVELCASQEVRKIVSKLIRQGISDMLSALTSPKETLRLSLFVTRPGAATIPFHGSSEKDGISSTMHSSIRLFVYVDVYNVRLRFRVSAGLQGLQYATDFDEAFGVCLILDQHSSLATMGRKSQ